MRTRRVYTCTQTPRANSQGTPWQALPHWRRWTHAAPGTCSTDTPRVRPSTIHLIRSTSDGLFAHNVTVHIILPIILPPPPPSPPPPPPPPPLSSISSILPVSSDGLITVQRFKLTSSSFWSVSSPSSNTTARHGLNADGIKYAY